MVRDLSETILATQYILNTKPSFLTIEAMRLGEKTIAKQSKVTVEKAGRQVLD